MWELEGWVGKWKTIQPRFARGNQPYPPFGHLPRLGRRVLAVLGKTSKPSLFSISNEKITIFLKVVSVHEADIALYWKNRVENQWDFH